MKTLYFTCPYCGVKISFDAACTFNWYNCPYCGGVVDMEEKVKVIKENSKHENFYNHKI